MKVNDIPIMNDKNYIKRESEGYRLIPGFGYDYSLNINESAYQMIAIIDGVKDVGTILNCLTEKYNNVDYKIIKNDFSKLLRTLIKVNAAKLLRGNLEMNKETIIYNNNNLEIIHLKEYDYQYIFDFLLNKELDSKVIFNSLVENTYNEISLRMGLFNYTEEYFALVENEEILAIISYKQTQTNLGNFYRNGIIKYVNNIDSYKLNILLKSSTEFMMNSNLINCKKVRFSFMSDDDFLKDILGKVGYQSVIQNNLLIGNVCENIMDYSMSSQKY